MADQYLLHFSDGSEYGPIDRATLDQWHQEGRIPPDALVWPDGAPEWVPVEDVFSEARPAAGGAGTSAPASDDSSPPAGDEPTLALTVPGAPAGEGPPSEGAPSAPELPAPAPGPQESSFPLEDLVAAEEPPVPEGPVDEKPESPPPPEEPVPDPEDDGPDTQPRAKVRLPDEPPRARVSGRTRAFLLLGGGVVLVLVLLGGLVSVLRPTLARRSAVAAIERYAVADRRVGDQSLGFVVDLPTEWVALREDNPFVITRGARLRVAHPALAAFGAVRVEAHPELMGDLDRHLDAVLQELRPQQPSLAEQGRSDIRLGRGRGRLVRTSWEEGAEPVQGATAAWMDGYEYYWLHAWAPASAGEDFLTAFQDLMRALAPSGALGARVDDAAERLAVEVPELSSKALRLLIGERMSEGQSLEDVPVDALRRVSRGLDALSAAESGEMGEIYGQIWAPLSLAERRRLARVLERVKADRPVATTDVRALREVVKAGVVALPPEQRARLQELSGRALEKSLLLP